MPHNGDTWRAAGADEADSQGLDRADPREGDDEDRFLGLSPIGGRDLPQGLTSHWGINMIRGTWECCATRRLGER
jgi:hypothetical protein